MLESDLEGRLCSVPAVWFEEVASSSMQCRNLSFANVHTSTPLPMDLSMSSFEETPLDLSVNKYESFHTSNTEPLNLALPAIHDVGIADRENNLIFPSDRGALNLVSDRHEAKTMEVGGSVLRDKSSVLGTNLRFCLSPRRNDYSTRNPLIPVIENGASGSQLRFCLSPRQKTVGPLSNDHATDSISSHSFRRPLFPPLASGSQLLADIKHGNIGEKADKETRRNPLTKTHESESDDEDEDEEEGDTTIINEFTLFEYFEPYRNQSVVGHEEDDGIDNEETDLIARKRTSSGTASVPSQRETKCGEGKENINLQSTVPENRSRTEYDGGFRDPGFEDINIDAERKKESKKLRILNKTNKERGLEYIRADGTKVPARAIQCPCHCSKLKCVEKFDDELRTKLLSNYLQLTLSGQNQFLSNHIEVTFASYHRVSIGKTVNLC
ncbi:uncharacterized protein LOC131677931 [Topomyia yanbarensis]|uniref:uncharacterized protein LOC131677931 n=1 Tax=Topomyia yanbarensis TaxID=2498891 RepID=UPI00273CCB3E|nr:uncharacterized protein LOC131677931 [Topomyia yanbarensis]